MLKIAGCLATRTAEGKRGRRGVPIPMFAGSFDAWAESSIRSLNLLNNVMARLVRATHNLRVRRHGVAPPLVFSGIGDHGSPGQAGR
jgi:hypothetical protein